MPKEVMKSTAKNVKRNGADSKKSPDKKSMNILKKTQPPTPSESEDDDSEEEEGEVSENENDEDEEEDDEEEESEEWLTDDEESEDTEENEDDIPVRKSKKTTMIKEKKTKQSEKETSKFSEKFEEYLMELLNGNKYAKASRKRMLKDESDDDDEEELPRRKSKRICSDKDKKKQTKKDKRIEILDKESSDSDSESDEDYDDDAKDKDQNIMIILGGGSGGANNTEDGFLQYYDDPEAAEIEEYLNNENDDCNSEDEKTFMKEDYQEIDCPKEEVTVKTKTSNANKKDKGKKNSKTGTNVEPEEDESPKIPVEDEYKELIDLKKHLSEKLHKNPHSKILIRAMKDCRESISKLVKKSRSNNAKDYYKLIKTETKTTASEIDYFKNKLSHKEQVEIMKELAIINGHINIDKPYRLSLLQTNLPAKYKATVMQKLNVMRSMEPGESEYNKMKTWVDGFMRVPFNVYKSLSVNMDDGLDVCDKFMRNARGQLDECVYGLDDAKLQIMQLMGQWVTNPSAMGSAIAIHGPPGTGKTQLAKEGISKILGREFAFITLGGAGDSSFLEGHSYTYEGSMWGKIVQILMESKCMNPVIFFDELDKLSDSAKGQELTGILTHLTDTTQNNQFHDKYFSEVDFDISKCLFIFSYNDENLVNPILKDRMYRIKTKGYDCSEKVIIANKYILPKIREQVNFKEGDIIIPDETLKYIISSAKFTHNEEGVRNLKRCLEVIYTKLNLFRLMHHTSEGVDGKDKRHILGKDVDLKVAFPFTVTKRDVDLLIRSDDHASQSLLAMYV